MLRTPLQFVPYMRPLVWGGRRLGTTLGKPVPANETVGESWEVSDHPTHRSVVAKGPHAGVSLRSLMETERAALLGPAASALAIFPWLVKFIDAHDWLSVQVHPNEKAVQRLWPGEQSKTEAWYVVDVLPGSRIYAGLQPGVDERRLRAALAAGVVAECLHSFTPQPGDCIYLPAGTVHAVGGGVLLAEVQQTSDATFRLFDWNRKDAQGRSRKLHIEEAIASIAWSQGPVHPVRPDGSARQMLVRSPYFTLEHLGGTEVALGNAATLQVLIVVQGQGRLETGEGVTAVGPGDVFVLPAAMEAARLVATPALGALLATLPC